MRKPVGHRSNAIPQVQRQQAPMPVAPESAPPAVAPLETPPVASAAETFARAALAPTPEARRHVLDVRLQTAAALAADPKGDKSLLSGLTSSADGTLDAASTALSPSSPLSAPQANAQPGTRVTRGRRGASADAVAHTGHGQVASGLSASAGAISIYSTQTRVTGTAQGASASIMDGFALAGTDWTWADSGGGVHRRSAWLGGWKDSAYVGGGIGKAAAGGATAELGGYVGGSASRDVTDLGPYQGDEPSLQGLRAVEHTRNLGGTLSANAGWAAAVLGVGGTLTADRSKSVVYRTHVTPAVAQQWVHDERGLGRALNNRLRALGAKEDPVTLPELARPESLSVGESLVLSTRGSLTMGLAVGAGGATAGVLATVQGSFEMAARRLDARQVELCVTPTDVAGVQLNAGLPFLADLRHTRAHAHSLRQAFVFDLGTASGRTAYQAALRGKLPGALDGQAPAAATPAEGLRSQVAAEKLPDGVRRTHLALLDGRRTETGVGLGFGLITDGALAGLAGLSFHKVHTTDSRQTLDAGGGAIFHDVTRGVEKRREVLISGAESAGVWASLHQLSTYDDDGKANHSFVGLTLRARFADSRVRGLELNDEVIDRVNNALGTELLPFSREGRQRARTISLERTLDAAALTRLANLNHAAVESLANRSGVAVHNASALVAQLVAQPDAPARAAAVQAFVADHGLGGLGFVHRALGGQLAVSTQADVYDRPVQAASALALEHSQPVGPEQDNATLARRFTHVHKALQDTEAALLDAQDDPLMDAATQRSVTESLHKAASTLAALVAVDHLDAPTRAALHARLDKGWTTSGEARVMAALAEVGP